VESAGQARARCGGGGGKKTVKRTPNKIKDLTTPGTQIMVLVQYLIFELVKKKIAANLQRIIELFTQKSNS
jgi:hypothetical protein